MKNYIVVGLTGQSGAGKTTVSDKFSKNNFYIINCDMVSRKVTEKGSECCKALAKIFPDCFNNELELDRKKLGCVVFSDKEKLNKLNDTIFPYIISYINKEITLAVNNGEKYILLDAPTLFEAKMESTCDYIVSVVANFDVRLERICKRDNLTEIQGKNRLSSQNTEKFFRENSDFIIENNTDLDSINLQTQNVINKIKEMANVHCKDKEKKEKGALDI